MKITIAPGRADVSICVTLAHIAAVLEHTLDSALPAGEALTIELTATGSVTVTRQTGQRLSYIHPRARAAIARQQAAQTDPAQLNLFDARTA
jgi:hypothetical protein